MKRLGTCLLLLTLLIVTLCSCSNRDPRKEAAGERVIAQIEEFHKRNGRLPATTAEMGIQEDESGPVFYQRKSEDHYIVWYGTTLGESMTYDSATRRWEEHN